MAAVLAFYETVKYLLKLQVEGSLRYSMFLLLILDIHPHYYSWWSYVNYFNDDFYKQFIHQTFFTVTECVSSFLILRMSSKKEDITPVQLLVVLSINIVHILLGGLDQFFKQFLFIDGKTFQRIRNLGFLIPDIFHVIIPLTVYKKSIGQSCGQLLTKKQVLWFTCLTIFLFLIGKIVLK